MCFMDRCARSATVRECAGAGTDDAVSVVLTGAKRTSDRIALPSHPAALVPGSCDGCSEVLLPLGELSSAVFIRDGKSARPHWHLSHAEVTVQEFDGEQAGRVLEQYVFLCRCDLNVLS